MLAEEVGGCEGEADEEREEHYDRAHGAEVGGLGERPGVAAGGVLDCEVAAGLGEDVGDGGCEDEEDAAVVEEEA